jgi:hypothetical protein
MAEIRVWASDLFEKRLPAVCTKSGAPADLWIAHRYKDRRRSRGRLPYVVTLLSGVLLWGGIGFVVIPFVLVFLPVASPLLVFDAIDRLRHGSCFLPFSRRVQRRMAALRDTSLLIYGAGFAFAALGFTLNLWGLALAFVAWLVAVIFALLRADVKVECVLRKDKSGREFFTLGRVHPAFVDAVKRRLADRPLDPR